MICLTKAIQPPRRVRAGRISNTASTCLSLCVKNSQHHKSSHSSLGWVPLHQVWSHGGLERFNESLELSRVESAKPGFGYHVHGTASCLNPTAALFGIPLETSHVAFGSKKKKSPSQKGPSHLPPTKGWGVNKKDLRADFSIFILNFFGFCLSVSFTHVF